MRFIEMEGGGRTRKREGRGQPRQTTCTKRSRFPGMYAKKTNELGGRKPTCFGCVLAGVCIGLSGCACVWVFFCMFPQRWIAPLSLREGVWACEADVVFLSVYYRSILNRSVFYRSLIFPLFLSASLKRCLARLPCQDEGPWREETDSGEEGHDTRMWRER